MCSQVWLLSISDLHKCKNKQYLFLVGVYFLCPTNYKIMVLYCAWTTHLNIVGNNVESLYQHLVQCSYKINITLSTTKLWHQRKSSTQNIIQSNNNNCNYILLCLTLFCYSAIPWGEDTDWNYWFGTVKKGAKTGKDNGFSVLFDIESFDYGYYDEGSEGLKVGW